MTMDMKRGLSLIPAIILFVVAIGALEDYYSIQETRAMLKRFEQEHPVPWSTADHEIRRYINGQVKATKGRILVRVIQIPWLLLLVYVIAREKSHSGDSVREKRLVDAE